MYISENRTFKKCSFYNATQCDKYIIQKSITACSLKSKKTLFKKILPFNILRQMENDYNFMNKNYEDKTLVLKV